MCCFSGKGSDAHQRFAVQLAGRFQGSSGLEPKYSMITDSLHVYTNVAIEGQAIESIYLSGDTTQRAPLYARGLIGSFLVQIVT